MKIFNKCLWCLAILFVFISATAAESAPPTIPARIGGTLTVNGTQSAQATDTGYTFVVTNQSGTPSLPVAKDTDGLNASDWYVVDVPIYNADDQTGGANPGDTALIHVYKDGVELTVESPSNGRFTVGYSGSNTTIHLKVASSTVDNTGGSCRVTSITSSTADGYYKKGDKVDITINFSEAVTLSGGNLIVSLDTGGKAKIVLFDSQTFASRTYKVKPGDNSNDLNVESLELSQGATLQNNENLDCDLSLPTGSNLADNKDIVIDSLAPTSTATAPTSGNSDLSISWTASDTTSGVASTELWYKKASGGNWANTGLAAQTGTSGTFSYTPQDGDGTYHFATRSTDNAGNREAKPSGNGSDPGSCSIVVDTSSPIEDPDGDIDGDGMPNAWEDAYGLNFYDNSDASQDVDWDGLTNLQEYQNNTNPNDSDTDGDEIPDNWEVDNGLDPTVDDASEDPDGDGYSNLEEYNAQTDPSDYTYNQEPNKPVPSSPTDGETEVSLTPELATGNSSEPDDLHAQSQWQISSEMDFSSLLLDITTTSHLTSLRVPQSILDEGTSYYWRVRFYDDNLAASDWSEPYVFTTLTTSNDTDANGISDDQEVDNTVDLDGDGTPDIDQDDIKGVNTMVGDGVIGVSIEDSTTVISIESIESIDPDTISDTANRPESIPLGLITFKLKVNNPGDTAEVTLYFSGVTEEAEENLEDFLEMARWYKYDSINGWQDYSDYATFSEDRRSVRLELKDGDYGDADGTANGIIVDPSGLGAGNQAPAASFTADPTLGEAPLWVSFDATASSDPNGTIDSYAWDFGDDSSSSGEITSHEYTSAGTYTAILTVTDDDGATDTVTAPITVRALPSSNVVSSTPEVDGGGCFIATAAYDSSAEPHVKVLRDFRDRFLLTTSAGRAIVDLYYTYSPPVADFIARHDTVSSVMRWSLLSIVALQLGPTASIALFVLLFALMSITPVLVFRRMVVRRQT